MADIEALHHAAIIDENSVTQRENLPYSVSLGTALLARLIDTEVDLAIRQSGKKGAKLKKKEQMLTGFEKATQEQERRKAAEFARLTRRWKARQALADRGMDAWDEVALAYAENFLKEREDSEQTSLE